MAAWTHPALSTRAVAGASALALLALATGCDTIQSDFSQLAESFSTPSPAQAAQWAAQWAADPNDTENARRGTVLLANAPWGGAEPYVEMYRLYAEDATDPLLRAAALQALGRHGEATDATLVASNLASPFPQVRLAAARALQRLHEPAVADTIWTRLIDTEERSDIRVELAVSLGQYATPAVFQALVAALAQRELAVNAAAVDSLRTITGQEFGIDESAWLSYYVSTPQPFAEQRTYVYPVFSRETDLWDELLFWAPVEFESPGLPTGAKPFGGRRASAEDTDAAP